jgi:hypothetical protein
MKPQRSDKKIANECQAVDGKRITRRISSSHTKTSSLPLLSTGNPTQHDFGSKSGYHKGSQ